MTWIEPAPLVSLRELLAWWFADHHRGMPRMYEAIEIRDGKLPKFSW
jgi:hypothetical protein